jgi:NADH:ubiquinone oxidoreductase subunit 3 (subunit A)
MDLNNEILEIMQSIKYNKKLYDKITYQRFDLFNKLNDNLKDLKLQRIKVLDEIDQYETLDEQQNYTTLSTNKSYYTFIILFLVVCVIVFILTKIVLKTNFESVGGFGLLITLFFIVIIMSLLIYLNKR